MAGNKLQDNLDTLLNKLESAQLEQDLDYARLRDREKNASLMRSVSSGGLRPQFVNGRVTMGRSESIPYDSSAGIETDRQAIRDRMANKISMLRSAAEVSKTKEPLTFEQQLELKNAGKTPKRTQEEELELINARNANKGASKKQTLEQFAKDRYKAEQINHKNKSGYEKMFSKMPTFEELLPKFKEEYKSLNPEGVVEPQENTGEKKVKKKWNPATESFE